MTKIEFVESIPAVGRDGGPRAATYHQYRIDEREVAVEVYLSSIMMRGGKQLPSDKVQEASQEFLRHKIEQQGADGLPQNLTLDEPEMDAALSRLGLPRRF